MRLNGEVQKRVQLLLRRKEITEQLRTWILDRLDVVTDLNLKSVDLEGFVVSRRCEGPHASRLSDRLCAGA